MRWIGQITYDEVAYFREDVIIEAGNKLGIGTTSPAYTLDVDGVINTNSNYRQGGVKILGRESSNTVLEAGGDNDIIFETNNAEKVRVLSNGNVGIGTSSPGVPLEVQGSVKFGTAATGISHHIEGSDEYRVQGIDVDGNGWNSLHFKADGNDGLFLQKDTNNVGIGTTSPDDVLHVLKDQGGVASALKLENKAGANNTGFDIDFQLASSGLSAKIGAIRTNSPGAGDTDMFFSTSTNGSTATEAMRITHDGNVGIGTTSPASKLHVEGAVQIGVNDAGHDFTLYGDTANYNMMWDASSSRLEFNDNTKAMFGNGVDLQIYHTGSHSNIKHDGTGDLIITQAADDQDIILQCDDGSGGTTAYLTLDGSTTHSYFSAGNVGIGTTSPDASLEVASVSTDYVAKFSHNTGTGYAPGSILLEAGQSTNRGQGIFHYNTEANESWFTGVPYSTYSKKWIVANIGSETTFNPDVAQLTYALFTIDSDTGNVGIGTTSPASKLHVAGTVQVGVDDTGHDVKFFGATASHYMLWDESADLLQVAGDLEIKNANGSNPSDAGSLVFNESGTAWGSNMYGFRINLEGSSNLLQFQSANTSTVSTILTMGRDNLTSTFSGPLTVGVNDTGHDVKFFGATSGRSMLWDESYDGLILSDNTKLQLGSSTGYGDLQLLHDGTNSYIQNAFGQLYINQNVNDGDIVLQCDDGSGGLTAYLTLDGSATKVTLQKDLRADDNIKIQAGSSGDVYLLHNGTDSKIENGTGDFIIEQLVDDKDIILKCDDGSGGTTAYLTLDGSAGHTKAHKEIQFEDNVIARFGAGDDMATYHDGSNTYIKNETGNLILQNNADDADIAFYSDDQSGSVAEYLRLDGSMGISRIFKALRANDDVKFQAGSGGDLDIFHSGTAATIENKTGNLTIKNSTDDGDIIFQSDDGSGGVETYFFLDGSANVDGNPRTKFPDGSRLIFGSGDDLEIYHNSVDSWLRNNTGDLKIVNYADDKDIILYSDDGSGGVTAYLTLDGSAGHTTVQKKIKFEDSVIASFGAGDDFYISHNGSYTSLMEQTGHLYISNSADDKDIIFRSDDGSGGFETYFFLDGSSGHTTFPDSKILSFGNSQDLRINHDGSTASIFNTTGNLQIINYADDSDIKFMSDDGSGGTTAYLTLDGGLGWTVASKNIQFSDSIKASFGSSVDMIIQHNGTNSYIENATGNLEIINGQDDGDIIFKSDDGNGGVTTYFTLDGSLANGTATYTRWADNDVITLGNSQDCYFYHNATNTYLYNNTGDLIIQNVADDKDIIFKSDDGSGGSTAYLTLDGSAGYTTVQKRMRFDDAVELQLGASGDLTIKHDGSHNYILGATGNLHLQSQATNTDVIFETDDGAGGNAVYFRLDGSQATHDGSATTSLYTNWPDKSRISMGTGHDLQIEHDGTDSNISNYVGDFYIQNQADDKDIIFKCDDGSGGTTAYLTLDGSLVRTEAAKDILFLDDVAARFGNSGDLLLTHDGSNSYISQNVTGALYIENNATDGDVILRSDDGSGGTTPYLTLDGGLGYMTAAKSLRFSDSTSAYFGNSNDLTIQHDGSNSYINNGTGDLYIRQNTDNKDIIFQSDNGSGGVAIYTMLDGSEGRISTKVNNRFDDGAKLELGTSGDLDLYHDGSHSYINNATGDLVIRNQADDGDISFQADNGSGGDTTYLTIDGSAVQVLSSVTLKSTPPNANTHSLILGRADTGSVWNVNHAGADFRLYNTAGSGSDILFGVDSGSGAIANKVGIGVATPASLLHVAGTVQVGVDDTGHDVKFYGATSGKYLLWDESDNSLDFADATFAKFGTGGDLTIEHNGSHSYITNNTGDFKIKQHANDADLIFECDDGSGGTTEYFRLDGSSENVLFSKLIKLSDNVELRIGDGNDLKMFSDGTDGYISGETGDLYIRQRGDNKDIIFQSDDGSGGVATYFYLDGSEASSYLWTKFPDNSVISLGTGNDFTFWHDGTNTNFKNHTGDLIFTQNTNDKDISFLCDDGSGGTTAYLTLDGSAETVVIDKPLLINGAAIKASPNLYDNIIKLLPSDFVTNDDGGVTKFGIGYVDAAGSTYGMKPTNADTELYTFVSIPQGMKATHVDVFDKYNKGVIVYEAQINATTLTSKGTGNCNTQIDITDVNATATNFLAIQVTTTATSDRVFGGQVTIAAI